ncbi:MAG: response regulator, partial [Niabella sp.]
RNKKLPFESFSGKQDGGFSFGAAISSFFQINKDKILVTSEDNGVSVLNPQAASFSGFPYNSLISYNNIHDIALDDSGHLWVGTYLHGIDVIDLSRKHKIRLVNKVGAGIHSNSILRLLKDKRGNIHIGTVLGASMYNITDHTINRQEITHAAVIRDILEDSKGNIWYVSMNKGVFRYQPTTGRWTVFNTETSDIPTDKFVCAREDEKGVVWFGTEGFGLLKFIQRTGRFEQVDKEAGLPDNYIFSIECADNFLWIGTTNGFCRYNPVTGSVKSYSEEDGLTDRYFNYNSSRKMANGDLYFGTVNGFFRFNPGQVKIQPQLPPVYITGLEVSDRNHNKVIKYFDFDVLSSGKKEFKFPFGQNNIKIEFTALSYMQSSKTEYRYVLEGFETKWNTIHNKRSVEYGNLPPGNYVFTLQVSNGDDIWLKHPLQLHLVVKKPYWQTRLAWAIYSVLLVSLFLFSIRYIKRKERQKYNRKEEIRKQETATAQINFFTNLTHEIKTPLSLLKVPIEVFKDDKEFPEKHQQVLAIMDRNAAWLENLVDELLGFQKIAEQQYQVNPVKTDVTSLLQNLAERFSEYAIKNDITFKFISSFSNPVIADIDARAIVKAVSNLIVNGFKHTRTRLLLTLRPDKDTPGYKIAVHDNGNGIKKEDIARVFEPFAQLEPVKKMKGVGIGLAYARSLVALHQGHIELHSNVGRWCVATIHLPKCISSDATTSAPPDMINYDDLIPSLPFIETDSLSEQNWAVSNEAGLAHILVVEDTVEIAYNLVTFLKPRYQVGYCKNGADALEYISKFQPDIIISDIIMPEMDGVELCRNVKANALTSHIQVILLTAKTTSNDRLLGLEVGANAYINKPFLLKEVELTIKNLLQLRTALRDRLLQGTLDNDAVPVDQFSEYDKAFIKEVAVIVDENLDNVDFKTDDFAEKLGMSKTLVYIKLKKLLNMSPNEYLLNIRFNKAQQLLLQERQLTIAEIAYEVGFSDPNYFSRAFKQHVGLTPSAFRNKKDNLS